MKKLQIFLLFLIIIGLALLLTQKFWVPKLTNWILQSESTDEKKQTPFKPMEQAPAPAPISISTQKIEEENVIGRMSIISGSSLVVAESREYIKSTVADFRKRANTEVPELRKEWGPDRPKAFYEIDIDAEYIGSDKTESIVMSVYTYTGGAHGNTTYKVMTADIDDGKILSLSDVIKKESQSAFVEFVKKELNNNWFSEDGPSLALNDFTKDLKFNSFSNWSFDDKNLIIYFDQYQVGPGALGAPDFPISKEKIKNFLRLPSSTDNSIVKEFTVLGKNFSFTPSSIKVKKGDKVKITFKNENGFHDFKIAEYGVATKQTQSPTTEVLEFTADKVGSFEYYCSVGTHKAMGMKGTLVVES